MADQYGLAQALMGQPIQTAQAASDPRAQQPGESMLQWIDRLKAAGDAERASRSTSFPLPQTPGALPSGSSGAGISHQDMMDQVGRAQYARRFGASLPANMPVPTEAQQSNPWLNKGAGYAASPLKTPEDYAAKAKGLADSYRNAWAQNADGSYVNPNSWRPRTDWRPSEARDLQAQSADRFGGNAEYGLPPGK